MKTLDRYIAGIFLKNLGLAAFSLAFLYLFQSLLGELFEGTYPAQQVIFYRLLHFPEILVQLLPPSVLLATVLTLSSLNRSNELVAIFSIGIGLPRILGVLVSVVFMVCCLTLVIQDRVLPPVFKKRTAYYWREMKKRHDFFLDVRQDKIWYRSKNLIYNLKNFDAANQVIHGMTVYTFSEKFELMQVVQAESARFTSNEWQLFNGTVTVFQEDDHFPLTQRFEEKRLQIQETPTDFQEIEKEVNGLRLKELYRYIQRIRETGVDTKVHDVQLHSRISLSFIPLVMCFLGVPFSTRNRRQGGVAKDLAVCLLITFFYWLFYSIGLSLGTNGALPPWLAAWLPSTIFAALAVMLILRRQQS